VCVVHCLALLPQFCLWLLYTVGALEIVLASLFDVVELLSVVMYGYAAVKGGTLPFLFVRSQFWDYKRAA